MAADANALIFGADYRVVTAAVSTVSLLFSLASITFSWQAKRLSERETAKSVYRKYLELAFENPKFSMRDIALDTFDGEERTKYRLFVSLLLHASEEILDRGSDKDWKATISRQLDRHRSYLAQMTSGGCSQYDKKLRVLVRSIVGGNW